MQTLIVLLFIVLSINWVAPPLTIQFLKNQTYFSLFGYLCRWWHCRRRRLDCRLWLWLRSRCPHCRPGLCCDPRAPRARPAGVGRRLRRRYSWKGEASKSRRYRSRAASEGQVGLYVRIILSLPISLVSNFQINARLFIRLFLYACGKNSTMKKTQPNFAPKLNLLQVFLY